MHSLFARITESAFSFMRSSNLSISLLRDFIREWIETGKKGDCLTPAQLEEIEKALVAVMRLKDYFTFCSRISA